MRCPSSHIHVLTVAQDVDVVEEEVLLSTWQAGKQASEQASKKASNKLLPKSKCPAGVQLRCPSSFTFEEYYVITNTCSTEARTTC